LTYNIKNEQSQTLATIDKSTSNILKKKNIRYSMIHQRY